MKRIFFGIGLVLVFFISIPSDALAAGILVNPESEIFSVINAIPGGEYTSREVRIENAGDKKENLDFKIEVEVDSESLAKKLFLKIKDGEGNCVWGCAYEKNLQELQGAEMKIAEISQGEVLRYRFYILFDPEAGNEFQGLLARFNLSLGYAAGETDGGEEIVVLKKRGDDDDGGKDKKRRERNHSRESSRTDRPTAFSLASVPGVPGEEGNVGGGSFSERGGEADDSGAVKGEESRGSQSCQGLPFWFWLASLAVYVLAFWRIIFFNFAGMVEKAKLPWKGPLAVFSSAAGLWYFFDYCQEFYWFLNLSFLSGFLLYLLFFYLFKIKIRKIRKIFP